MMEVAGARYTRTHPNFKRWGCNEGSVFLGDQKVSVRVPRVRDVLNGKEIPFSSYQGFQNPGSIDEVIFKRLINGISTRKYEKAALEIPATFGIKKSSISRKFIRASARKLKECLERDLSGYDIVSIFIDGKGFAENEVIIALGMFPKLGTSFKTTNCIENIMLQMGIYTDRVSYWKNSDQRQRWVGTALQEIEPKLRTVRGYRHLRELRDAMRNLNYKENIVKVA